MKIPLFDIDLTLSKLKEGKDVHDDAFDFAFKSVYGMDVSKKEIVTHGMIDTQIIGEVLRLHGVGEEQIEAKMEDAVSAMVKYFKEHKAEGEYEALPYTREILLALKGKNIPRGVLTGNIEEIAWFKLEQVGLRGLVQFGAFGNLARKRVDLIDVAVKRAHQIGINEPREKFVIVGDAKLDIICAKQGGIKSIGVATGAFSKEELAEAGADLVIQSFAERNRFINFFI